MKNHFAVENTLARYLFLSILETALSDNTSKKIIHTSVLFPWSLELLPKLSGAQCPF